MIVPAVAGLLLLAGCGGNTPAEDAYLAEMQRRSAEIELSDPGEHLDRGHAICDEAAKLKPADRDTVAWMSAQSLGWINNYYAAKEYLCPDVL